MNRNLNDSHILPISACQSLRQQALKALKFASQQGATSAQALASMVNGLSATVRLGEVDTLEFHQSQGITLTVYFDQAKGKVNTTDCSDQAIENSVKAACDIAKLIASDPYAGLADTKLLAYDYPEIDLFFPWELSAKEAIALATRCEQYGLAKDKRLVNADGTTVDLSHEYFVCANSLGFIGEGLRSNHSISTVLVAQDAQGLQRDYDYTLARDPQDLLPIEVIADNAAKKTLARLGARKIPTGEYPVIFKANVAAGLFGALFAAIQGASLYQRASFLIDSVGKTIFPEFVTITEKPLLPKGLHSAPFDADGLYTREKKIIDQGVLQTYLLSLYTARRLGLPPTGNGGGVFNALVETSTLGFEALLKQMDKGVVITELMGQGTNIVTGDYSRGACGYWVEHGEIQFPIEEVTVAGNLRDMFQRIVAIGDDVDHRHNIQTGSVFMESLMVAGV